MTPRQVAAMAAFVLTQLDADEAAARACHPSMAWHQADPRRQGGRIEDAEGDVIVYDEGAPSGYEAAHICRHDPARILQGVAGKRAIAEELARIADLHRAGLFSHDPEPSLVRWGCYMAAEWAGQPGYKPEWEPRP